MEDYSIVFPKQLSVYFVPYSAQVTQILPSKQKKLLHHITMFQLLLAFRYLSNEQEILEIITFLCDTLRMMDV